MARQKNYQVDNTVHGGDKLLITDVVTGATRNLTVDELAAYWAANGQADGSKVGFHFTYVGQDFEAGQAVPSGTYTYTRSETGGGFSTVTQIYCSGTTRSGVDFGPAVRYFTNNDLKLTDVSGATSTAYGIYQITAVTEIEHVNGNYWQITVNHKGSGSSSGVLPAAADSEVSISMLGQVDAALRRNTILEGSADPIVSELAGQVGDIYFRKFQDGGLINTSTVTFSAFPTASLTTVTFTNVGGAQQSVNVDWAAAPADERDATGAAAHFAAVVAAQVSFLNSATARNVANVALLDWSVQGEVTNPISFSPALPEATIDADGSGNAPGAFPRDEVDIYGPLSANVPDTNGSYAGWGTPIRLLNNEGRAATVIVGGTTTLDAGSPAYVTNAGDNHDAILQFGIPRGNTGAAGADGMDGAAAGFGTPIATTVPLNADGTIGTPTVTASGPDTAKIFEFGIPQGATGPQGPSGTPGDHGNALLNGTVDPTNSVPADARDGDFYINTAANTIWGPYNSTNAQHWGTSGTSIVGPQGPEGQQGNDGREILHGNGTPGSGDGKEGDFWLDTATTTLYGPRTASAWPATGVSLIGPQGPAGTNGTNGTNGLNGASVLHGDTGGSAPANTVGNNNDFFIDTSDYTIYGPKASGVWPATGTSLVGNASLKIEDADGVVAQNGIDCLIFEGSGVSTVTRGTGANANCVTVTIAGGGTPTGGTTITDLATHFTDFVPDRFNGDNQSVDFTANWTVPTGVQSVTSLVWSSAIPGFGADRTTNNPTSPNSLANVALTGLTNGTGTVTATLHYTDTDNVAKTATSTVTLTLAKTPPTIDIETPAPVYSAAWALVPQAGQMFSEIGDGGVITFAQPATATLNGWAKTSTSTTYSGETFITPAGVATVPAAQTGDLTIRGLDTFDDPNNNSQTIVAHDSRALHRIRSFRYGYVAGQANGNPPVFTTGNTGIYGIWNFSTNGGFRDTGRIIDFGRTDPKGQTVTITPPQNSYIYFVTDSNVTINAITDEIGTNVLNVSGLVTQSTAIEGYKTYIFQQPTVHGNDANRFVIS